MLNSNIEILSPVGDFECLKAAVQNGANAVYLGVQEFNARYSASNFNLEDLEKAIIYAKTRGVKVHLVLNILIKNNEFESAFYLAKKAYELGIDAIIVQDLGLALTLIKAFPDLPIHASTQMTVHNLEGVRALEKLGFKRVVLSRELSFEEIDYICKNSNIEIECFIHGALCVSYSGQCLLSSIIGGRSGNRGKCAGTCRLPYELIDENEKVMDKGYLLSTRDLCGLEYLPSLVKAGVVCFKIEGRMKTPEYVATVTRIYRKYLDKILSNGNYVVDENCVSDEKSIIDEKCVNNENYVIGDKRISDGKSIIDEKYVSNKNYVIDENDIKELQLVFNRGGFSNGYFDKKANKDLVFKEKPNHMGIYLGKIIKYNSNKGYITLKLENDLDIGDKIAIDNKGVSNNYTISELMINNSNIKSASKGQTVTIGRMKGNININDKIFLIESKNLTELSTNSYQNVENKQLLINCKLIIKENTPIKISANIVSDSFNNVQSEIITNIIPETAKNAPITKEKIIEQFSKTKNTIFKFNNLNIELDDNLFLTISSVNELRRLILNDLEIKLEKSIKRNVKDIELSNEISGLLKSIEKNMKCVEDSNEAKDLLNADKVNSVQYYERKVNDIEDGNDVLSSNINNNTSKPSISVLLNILNKEFNYWDLKNIDRLYIPLKYFVNPTFKEIIFNLSKKFNLYIYMPTIMKGNYINLLNLNINSIMNTFKVKGAVISSIYQLNWFKNYGLDIIGNYTLNVFNNISVANLSDLGVMKFTLSPELDRETLLNLSNSNKNAKLIVYGKIPVMNSNYCVLGRSNKCYKECAKSCQNSNKKFYLKDRLNFKFRVIPDNIDTISTIYNSKITSITWKDFNVDNLRIDILDEDVDTINLIVSKALNNERFEGKDYTNANLNKEI